MDKSLSYHEWEKRYAPEPEFVIESEEILETLQEEEPEREQTQNQAIACNTVEDENQTTLDSPETPPSSPSTPRNEALSHLHRLCRVCSSQGLINISSHLSPKLFAIKTWGDMRQWQIPIAKILAEVSGENVRKLGNCFEFHHKC